MVIWAIFVCVNLTCPLTPLSALTSECFKVPQGEGGGLALGTVGPQSACGAFVADLIRGRLTALHSTAPWGARSKHTTYVAAVEGEAKILNKTISINNKQCSKQTGSGG